MLIISQSVKSQVGGEQVYQFLNLSTSARQIALGGEVLNIMNDVSQPLWNPAVLNDDLDRKLSVNYTNYLAGINLGSLSYATKISRRFGMMHTNITYLDYGTIIGADEQGIETGNFGANDLAITLGYSYNFPRTNIYAGVNFKFINAAISNFNSFGVAADFSILYFSPFQPFSFTLVARNLGTQIKSFTGSEEDIPLKVAFGASYKLQYVPLKWYLTIDNLQRWNLSVPNPSNQTSDLNGNITQEKISFLANTFRHFIVGAELFPESLINVRLGYNFKRAAELKLQNVRTFSGISFGFGVQMNRFKLNYAYSKFHSASNASTFSLEIDLDTRTRFR